MKRLYQQKKTKNRPLSFFHFLDRMGKTMYNTISSRAISTFFVRRTVMIDFKGELTGKSRKFLLKKQSKIQVIAFSLSLIVVFPVILALAIRFSMSIIWCYLGISILILILTSLPSDKKSQKTFMPIRVYVDLEDEVIVNECETCERFHGLDTVKAVYDYGEWYYFKFYFSI